MGAPGGTKTELVLAAISRQPGVFRISVLGNKIGNRAES